MHHRRVLPILLACSLVLLGAACGDDESADTTTSSSTTASTTSTTASTTTTTTVVVAPGSAVWPPADGSVTYSDPVQAATGFATELAGFTDPVVGEFQQGDNRSGEVEVRPRSDGPVTTVLVRQLGSEDSWSVIGAATDNIRPTLPAAGATVTSPAQLGGTSTAFEATVQVAVHARSAGEPLGRAFVMGGSMGDMGPFEGTIDFDAGGAVDGSILFFSESMEDGRVWEVAAVPVAFAAG